MNGSKWPSGRPPTYNALHSLARMMGRNGQVMDLPWGVMDGSKWPSGGPPMHNALCSLVRMMGENGQVVELPLDVIKQAVELPCTKSPLEV